MQSVSIFVNKGRLCLDCYHMAYFLVHSLASSLYRGLSVLKIRAMSGTSGSSGLGSHNRLHIERRTVCTCVFGEGGKGDVNIIS